jgi:hypothetical protein
VFNFAFEVEHILPTSQGGTDHPGNLALACHSCNRFKSDFVSAVDADTNQPFRLYNPRTDIWQKHFRVDLETAEIHGISPTGRATVVRLQMNRTHQVSARRYWIQLDLFP